MTDLIKQTNNNGILRNSVSHVQQIGLILSTVFYLSTSTDVGTYLRVETITWLKKYAALMVKSRHLDAEPIATTRDKNTFVKILLKGGCVYRIVSAYFLFCTELEQYCGHLSLFLQ